MVESYLFCTNEPNDTDLVRTLGSSAIAVPLFTDCCFSSVDEKLVAVERKKIGDMANCVLTGRFLFQMQNCKAATSDYLILILEGRYRRNPEDGLLEIPVWGFNPRTSKRCEVWELVRPTIQFSRFDQYLTEIQRDAGIIVKHTENVRGTADVILALYQNFQTPQSEHQSLKQIFKPPTPTVQLIPPSLVRRIAAELPGLGWEWSRVAAEKFVTVLGMVDATVDDWAGLTITADNGKTRKLGRKTAEKIVKSLGR